MPGGMARLRLVPKGTRRSLEDTLEDTRKSARWASYFPDVRDPYLHWTPEPYGEAAERSGFKVVEMEVQDKSGTSKAAKASRHLVE